MNEIYAAMYSDGPESALGLISVHLTREGAEAAVAAHKEKERLDWKETCDMTDSLFQWSDDHGSGFSAWAVRVYEVQP